MNGFEPDLGRDAVAILERNGFSVIVPEQECCGLPFISNGLYDHARRKARRNLGSLAVFARAGYRIVGTSTSCTHALKAEYREMLDLADPDARAVADATWDICELLLDLHDRGELDTGFGAIAESVPYHPPCQLRSHGIGTPAMDLFALVPGLRSRRLRPRLLRRRRHVRAQGRALADRPGRRRTALREGARGTRGGGARGACDSETCRWQIEQSSGVPTVHPVTILAESYRRADAQASEPWRRIV